MVSSQHIDQARAVSIVDYLASLGHRPVSQTTREYAYNSPLKQEHTPSFFVNPAKNVFADFSTHEQGDAIRLVRLLTGQNFPDAVQELLKFQGQSFSFSGPLTSPIPPSTNRPAFDLVDVRPLTHPALLSYSQSRGILPDVAKRYCQEVHYVNKGKLFFAVGFANDGGGYALRSAKYKGQTVPAGYTTLTGQSQKTANVFEGFFDFLSAVQLFGSPSNITIVLNSTANVTKSLPVLKSFDSLNLYLDRDKAGYDVVARLEREGLKVFDRSTFYEKFNDLNQFLVNQ